MQFFYMISFEALDSGQSYPRWNCRKAVKKT